MREVWIRKKLQLDQFSVWTGSESGTDKNEFMAISWQQHCDRPRRQMIQQWMPVPQECVIYNQTDYFIALVQMLDKRIITCCLVSIQCHCGSSPCFFVDYAPKRKWTRSSGTVWCRHENWKVFGVEALWGHKAFRALTASGILWSQLWFLCLAFAGS